MHEYSHPPTLTNASSPAVSLPEERSGWALGLLVSGLTAIYLLGSSPAFAETDLSSKVSFHAYFTQAYGQVDGAPVFGLTESGTFDYHSGALLFGYQISDRDKITIQLSSEALGASKLDNLRDEIELDWAFYEHSFESGPTLRAGRVPIPFGIYNEIRDVGTLLEFYRPPVGIYFEGAFSSETVDGAVLSHTFFPSRPWNLEVDVYAGSWDRTEYVAPEFAVGRAEDAYGVQLWLETPISGLRFGLAAQQFDMKGGFEVIRVGVSDRFKTGLVSIDANFSRFFLRGEYIKTETQIAPIFDVDSHGFYLMGGLRITEKLEVNLLFETSVFELNSDFGGFVNDPSTEDLAASLVYRFNPNALVRFELHRFETVSADIALPPGEASLRSDYGIVSISATF